ncbi:MAG: glutamate--tRNA ligase [Rikenellaceae bacterium]
MQNREVRVRFAPSPTGALHIGGVRTALYNYLFARQNGGKFLLRIEDTDSQRFVPGAEEYIIESLKWCGIEIDEGVSVGGEHAPYRQSERREIYLKYATELVENGWAYYAFDTSEELTELRSKYEAEGKTFAYNYEVRTSLRTSLSMDKAEVEELLKTTNHWVVRFKMPENEEIAMHDLVRGDVKVNSSTLDDKVLYKAVDKLPTYHLANIVDDYLMQISHVIRGEEWLPSLPLHFMLYKAFGWSEKQPLFAHLPLLMKPDGKGKLSKRDGDRLGFPVFPLFWQAPNGIDTARGYREDGYLPEAFINMLALLGWNPGNDQEIMSMEEMIKLFSIEKCGKSGSRFDPEKAKWFNSVYIKSADNALLSELVMPQVVENGVETSIENVEKVVALVKDRASLLTDFWSLMSLFFVAPTAYDEKAKNKFWKNDNPKSIAAIIDILAGVEEFTAAITEPLIHAYIKDNALSMGGVMNSFRLAIVGESKGPSMFDIIEVLGKDETLRRLNSAVAVLGV